MSHSAPGQQWLHVSLRIIGLMCILRDKDRRSRSNKPVFTYIQLTASQAVKMQFVENSSSFLLCCRNTPPPCCWTATKQWTTCCTCRRNIWSSSTSRTPSTVAGCSPPQSSATQRVCPVTNNIAGHKTAPLNTHLTLPTVTFKLTFLIFNFWF